MDKSEQFIQLSKLQEMSEESELQLEVTPSSQLLAEFQTRNICYITENKIFILFKDELFEVNRDVQSVDDLSFQKREPKLRQRIEKEASQSIEFIRMYGMMQLQKTPVLVFIVKTQQVGNINKNIVYKVQQFHIVKVRKIDYEPFLAPLQLSFGLFKTYFCSIYNLSNRIQLHFEEDRLFQDRYTSNYSHTLKYDQFPSQLLTVCITGFVKSCQCVIYGKTIRVTLVSRANVNRIGRRWLRRGLDSAGNAANEYQTEAIWQIMTAREHRIYSYVQLRGSIPLFWKQTPCFNIKAQIQILKNPEKNKQSMQNYLQYLTSKYNRLIILNLVCKSGRENEIGSLFSKLVQESELRDCKFMWFDYGGQYSRLKGNAFRKLVGEIKPEIVHGQYCQIYPSDCLRIRRLQKNVIRTNCMDCLDRTNHIQALICKLVCTQLEAKIFQHDERHIFPLIQQTKQLQQVLIQLWKENGIAISQQYSGTSTMRNDLLEKGTRTVSGMLADLCISLHRFYLGHFSDYYYQNCIDLHFGKSNFETDCKEFFGSWKRRIFQLISFSGAVIFPLLLREKVIDKVKGKFQQYSILTLISLSGLAFGGIICKIAHRQILQSPLSRKQQLE